MHGKTILISLLIIFVSFPSFSGESGFRTSLPEIIFTNGDLCAHMPCRELIPAASSFSLRKGDPPYREAYISEAGRKKVIGYIILSSDLVNISGYSGKPIVMMIAMNTKGIITGATIIHHAESVLMAGISEDELRRFVKQYIGKFAGNKVKIGKAQMGGNQAGVDAITGATVTSSAINDIIMRSSYITAKELGIIMETQQPYREITMEFSPLSWDELISEGSVLRLSIRPSHLGLKESPEDQPVLDMYFGFLNQPSMGINILGEKNYSTVMRNLQKGDYAIFLIGNGEYSFKGSGFARGGLFERIRVSQNNKIYTFKDINYYNLSELSADGAPAFREGGIFIIKKGNFNPAHPWSLEVLVTKQGVGEKMKDFYSFSREYQLPNKYIKKEGNKNREKLQND